MKIGKAEYLTTASGNEFNLTREADSFVIETVDCAAPSGFGLRLEIGAVFVTREALLKAFQAFETALEKETIE